MLATDRPADYEAPMEIRRKQTLIYWPRGERGARSRVENPNQMVEQAVGTLDLLPR